MLSVVCNYSVIARVSILKRLIFAIPYDVFFLSHRFPLRDLLIFILWPLDYALDAIFQTQICFLNQSTHVRGLVFKRFQGMLTVPRVKAFLKVRFSRIGGRFLWRWLEACLEGC